VIIDLFSNRTPFHVVVTYLTFSTGSAYNRLLIWEYGTAEVWRHPFFGIGFADWVRPAWMSGSMDNFWLVIAVRYGMPAFLLLAAAFVSMIGALGRLRIDRGKNHCRSGLFVSLGGLIVAGCTVDYWNAIYCWLLFMLGCGMWMLEPPTKAPSSSIAKRRDRKRLISYHRRRSSEV
jgi:hypothetical protein